VRLHYVGIRVTNLPRSIRFYTQLLGLRVQVRGDSRSRGGGLWVGLEDPRSDAKLELNGYPPDSRFWAPFDSGNALDHVGFLLGKVSRRTLEKTYERLLAGGATPAGLPPESTGGWMACVKDPDGNCIEIFREATAAEKRAEQRGRSGSKGSPRKS
jgi:catechol 2,3-dioxygenase-like lactoylglutathione lyase family enzyme